MQAETNISQRRACQLVGLSRSTMHYKSRKPADRRLRTRLIELAAERKRFGYRRLHILLRREGFEVNHKKVYRLYREADLKVRKRRKRQRVAVERTPLTEAQFPNQVWSMDFVMDTLANGQHIKILTVVDDFTKEAVCLEVAHSITGNYVTRILDNVARFRGYPEAIRTDQGPEFTGRAVDQWAYQHGVVLKLIQAGKPTQNAYIESFNGKLRDECLNEHWFRDLHAARELIEHWREDYNRERPHSSLNYRTPEEFSLDHTIKSRNKYGLSFRI